MASDDKKTSPAPKNEAAVKKEAAAKKDEGQPKNGSRTRFPRALLPRTRGGSLLWHCHIPRASRCLPPYRQRIPQRSCCTHSLISRRRFSSSICLTSFGS
jgi:hypothetical protein